MTKISTENAQRILSENEIENLTNSSQFVANEPDLGEVLSEPSLRSLQSLASSRMGDLNLSAQLLQSSLNNSYDDYGANGKRALLFGGEWGSIGGMDFRTQGGMGSASTDGSISYGARGHAFSDVDWENGTAHAGFDGEVGVHANYKGEFSTPSGAPVGVDGAVEADGFVGAKGKGDVEVTLNENSPSISAEGEVFVGARGGIEGEITPSLGGAKSPVGAKYGAEGQVGVGASGNIDVGFKDGKFRFNITGGLALGLGGKASLGFELDYGSLLKLSNDFMNKLSVAAKEIEKNLLKGLKFAGKGLSKITTGFTKGLSALGKGAGKIGSDIGKGLSDAGKGAGKVLSDVGKGAVNTGKKVLKAFGIG